jgi:hypothetical protein
MLQVLLDITNLRLNLAEVLLNVAFCFQRRITDDFAGRFFDASFCLFDAAFNLVFVDTHYMLLIPNSGKRPARDIKKPGNRSVNLWNALSIETLGRIARKVCT